MEEKFSTFGLTVEQCEVLFALQGKITSTDIELGSSKSTLFGSDKKEAKKLWFDKWKLSISNYISSLGGTPSQIHLTDSELSRKIEQLDKDAQNKVWKYLVLLECVLYAPYYPLSDNKEEFKPFKGLGIDKNRKNETLEQIASILGIEKKYIETFRKAHSSAIKELSGYWTKVAVSSVIGIVVVLIAILTFQYEIIALFAAEGLTGAAAISAGLAALGGGAIAAGGMGMAGGMAVLIGGGSLLGIGAGGAAGLAIASLGANAVLSEAAKLQVVLKEIVLAIQKDTKYFQKILLDINKKIAILKDEIVKLKTASEDNRKKIKNQEASVKILEKLVESM